MFRGFFLASAAGNETGTAVLDKSICASPLGSRIPETVNIRMWTVTPLRNG